VPGRPKLNWADRALLATLLGVIPKARRQGLRLLVTPDTIVRWHRDIVRRRWREPPGVRLWLGSADRRLGYRWSRSTLLITQCEHHCDA
jgi:hypothetical protein